MSIAIKLVLEFLSYKALLTPSLFNVNINDNNDSQQVIFCDCSLIQKIVYIQAPHILVSLADKTSQCLFAIEGPLLCIQESNGTFYITTEHTIGIHSTSFVVSQVSSYPFYPIASLLEGILSICKPTAEAFYNQTFCIQQ